MRKTNKSANAVAIAPIKVNAPTVEIVTVDKAPKGKSGKRTRKAPSVEIVNEWVYLGHLKMTKDDSVPVQVRQSFLDLVKQGDNKVQAIRLGIQEQPEKGADLFLAAVQSFRCEPTAQYVKFIEDMGGTKGDALYTCRITKWSKLAAAILMAARSV